MTLGLIMLATAACDNRRGARQEAGGTPPVSAPAPPVTTGDKASLAARAPAHHKISVKLKKDGSKCVVESPLPQEVERCDFVRWKYKNQCGATKKPKIDRKNAAISGDCLNETAIEDGVEKEGKDCRVANNAAEGTHEYGILGDGVTPLDPELEIPPPPPPAALAAKPTPCPQ